MTAAFVIASPVCAEAGSCALSEHYSRQLISHLASYQAASNTGNRENAQSSWRDAKKAATASAWIASPGLSDEVCTLATDALVHYAGSWYAIDALVNGTFPTTALRLELAKTELGMAQAEAACAHLEFTKPSLSELETKLRHYVVAQHDNYEAIEGYPGNPMCRPY